MLSIIKKILMYNKPRIGFFHRFQGNERILELGCGFGEQAKMITCLFPLIENHGNDIIPENEIPSNIQYKMLDLEKAVLPYQSDFFDAILFIHVIEHLKAPLSLGSEIKRVLRPGGKIYIETPNWTTMFIPSFGFKRHQHYPFNFFDDPTHVKPWSQHGLYEYLGQGCELNIIKVGTVRNWLRVPIDMINIIYGFLSGNRGKITSSVQNIYGWCIYGIGEKV